MSNESFDVNLTDVPLINQLTNMSCWAASAAMVVGWRDRLSINPAAIAEGTGDWSAYANGLACGLIVRRIAGKLLSNVKPNASS